MNLRLKSWFSSALAFLLLVSIFPIGNPVNAESGGSVGAVPGYLSGEMIKLTVANDSTTGNHYIYQSFSNASYTFQSGDYIEYDVKIDNIAGGVGGIDVFTTDSQNFRDASWVDQNGIYGHPGSDISTYATRSVYHRKLAVPASRIGKTASKWVAAAENDTPGLTTLSYYDNIVVTDGNGTVRKVVYRGSADANLNTSELAAGISSSSMKTNAVQPVVTENEMGDVMRLIVTNNSAGGAHNLYQKFSSASYTFQSGDYVEYDVKLSGNTAAAGGVDVYTTDGLNFRDAGWSDQNGISGHPGADISAYAYKNWYHRKLAIPAARVGKTADSWLVAGENGTADASYSSLYDNIVVTDGNGTVKKVIYQNAADTNLNPNDAAYQISSYNLAVFPNQKLGLGVSANSYNNDQTKPGRATDGDTDGYWVSTAASPNWLQADLGSVRTLKRWVVWHASSGGDLRVYNTKDFKLQVSMDGATWSDADTVTGNTDGITDRMVDARARYVRLYITQGTQTGSDGYARIREFEVYSSDNDVAFNKPAVASAYYDAANAPVNAVNGKAESYDPGAYWFTSSASPNWLRVDLGKTYNISRWAVWHASSGGDNPVFNTRDFKLQVSSDGVNFTDADTVSGNTEGKTDRVASVSARYVRLYITQGTQTGYDGYIRIREFEVFGVPSEDQSPVSSGKTTTSSSNDTGADGAKAIDGDLWTRWRSSETGTQWLQVDLGQKHVISRWAAFHAGSDGEPAINNTKDYKLQVSDDGTTFTDVDTITDNAEPATDRNVDTYPAGRYVRLYITAGTQTGGDGKARINEFRVYGQPVSGAPNPQIYTTVYPTDDLVVASFDATQSPYGADKTGSVDATLAIQMAINDCYAYGGGTVYLPAGTYKISDTLSIPPYVTLRGDWQDPDAGTAYGTVISANVSSSQLETPGLIRISGSAGLKGVTIYYPNQSASSPVAYPYSIEIPGRAYGEEGYMHQTIQNVTLLNAYKGISVNRSNTDWLLSVGEEHYIRNVKGTVLKEGIRLFNSADVGRVIGLKFNNAYWAGAAAGYNPQTRTTLDAFTRTNGLGMEIGDADMATFYDISLSDYYEGIKIVKGARSFFTGDFFKVDVENSNKALQINAIQPYDGIKFSNCTLKANQGTNPVAVQVNDLYITNAPLLFNSCTIGGGASKAVEVLNSSYSPMVVFNNTTFDDWSGTYAITSPKGSISVQGSTFTPTLTSTKKAIGLSGTVAAALLGNTYTGSSAYFLDNTSTKDVKRQDTGYAFETHDVTGHTFKTTLPKPGNSNFYNVKTSFSAKGDGVTDDTAAIQNALNAAGAAGGGTVYMPPGLYKVSAHLTVPANVELRGSNDVPHKGDRMGTNLLAYEGRGTSTPDSDTAFVTLGGSGAGMRGLTVYYPEQSHSQLSTMPYAAYPWTVRGSADGVYAINVCLLNTYKGIDFGNGSNTADNHYLSYVNGSYLQEGISVGAGASEGWIEDSLFNATYWARSNLASFGSIYDGWEILMHNWTASSTTNAYKIGNVQNEHMLNNFVFGAKYGYRFMPQSSNGANAVVINGGTDSVHYNVKVEATGTPGVKFVNLSSNNTNDSSPAMFSISGGTAKFFNLGSGFSVPVSVAISGGTSVFQGAKLASGQVTVTGGSTKWNGVYIPFSGNTGPQITISSGVTASDFSGNMGLDSVNFVNNAGAGASLSNNIRYIWND